MERGMYLLSLAALASIMVFIVMEIYVWAEKVGEGTGEAIETFDVYNGTIYGDTPESAEDIFKQMLGQ